MALSREVLGDRLRAARMSADQTQDEVAAHLNISRSGVTQIEQGNRKISSIELDKLAYLYGRDIREFLADKFSKEDEIAVLFRKNPDVLTSTMTKAFRECIMVGRDLTNLERMLNIDRTQSISTYSFQKPKTNWEAIKQGSIAAEGERLRLNLGIGPVSDIAELLEIQGIRTILVKMPDGVSGITLRNNDGSNAVAVNENHTWIRRRFSFAHEYCHVITDGNNNSSISHKKQGSDRIEIRANSFAAEFLMPEEGVRTSLVQLGKGTTDTPITGVFDGDTALPIRRSPQTASQQVQIYDVVRLAHHFGVSNEAMIYRLYNIKLIVKSNLDKLRALHNAGVASDAAKLLGIVDRGESDTKNALKSRLLGLAIDALRRGVITTAKVREIASRVNVRADKISHLLAEINHEGIMEDMDVYFPEV